MKYIIEIENEPFGRNDDSFFPHGMDELYRAKGFKSLVFDQNGLDKLTPYTEPSQKAIDLQHAHDIENVARMNFSKGAEEAWDFVSKLVWSFGDKEILGMGIAHAVRDMTYQEAKAKYEAWLKKKDEICVGDEVIPLDTQYDTMVVTKLWVSEYGDEWVDTIAGDGKMYSFFKTSINKTGRHFDSVEKLLEEMREETE